MKQVICEWDIGQYGLVFKDGHAAERWLRNNLCLKDMARDDGLTMDDFYQDIVDMGLVSIEDLQLIE